MMNSAAVRKSVGKRANAGRPLPFERWELLLFAAILLLAATLRFWDLGSRAFHGDEAIHAGFAWQLLDGRGYVHNPLTHGPFQFFGTALVFLLFGDSDYTARLLPAIFGTAIVGLPFFLRGHIGRPGALIASLLLAVSPTLLYYSRFAREDIYMAFFTLALFICVWRYLAKPHRFYLYGIAALLALSFATKELAYIIVALLMVYLDVLAARELASQTLGVEESGWLPPRPQDDGSEEISNYAILGLPEGASVKTVRRAYKRLSRSNPHAPETVRLRAAYASLCVTASRADEPETPAVERETPGALRHLLVTAALLPTALLIVAFWPLLGTMRRRLGIESFPRAGNLLMLIGCLSLPLFAAAVQRLPFLGGYGVDGEVLLMRVTVMTLIAAAFVFGVMWSWRLWVMCSTFFWVIFIALFTSFFTNSNGFWTGT